MSQGNSPVEITSLSVIFLRIFWLFIGNFALVVCAMLIVRHYDQPLSGFDIAYGAFVPLVIFSRYVDIRFCNGCTVYGLPATMHDWRRYSFYMAAVSLLTWLAAHGIAYLLRLWTPFAD